VSAEYLLQSLCETITDLKQKNHELQELLILDQLDGASITPLEWIDNMKQSERVND